MSETLETTGVVISVLGNNNYLVEVSTDTGTGEILCHLGGKMRRFRISVIAGDEVTVVIPPPYDKGRITFRGKKSEHPVEKKKSNQRRKGRRGKRR